MLNELKNLLGVKVLSKEEQKKMMGGRACCDPVNECCMTGRGCAGTALCHGAGCSCPGGCQWCYSNPMLCGCV